MRKRKTPQTGEIIEGFAHTVQNNLQAISMGFDVLCLDEATPPPEWQTMTSKLADTARLVRELQEYVVPPKGRATRERLGTVLEEAARRIDEEWAGRKIRVTIHCPAEPSLLRLDWWYWRKAYERILSCACALLPQGGTVAVEARMRQRQGHRHLEHLVVCSADTPLALDDSDIFQPFLQINGYQLGLSLVLVRQRLRRGETLSFRKLTPSRGRFTLRIKV